MIQYAVLLGTVVTALTAWAVFLPNPDSPGALAGCFLHWYEKTAAVLSLPFP